MSAFFGEHWKIPSVLFLTATIEYVLLYYLFKLNYFIVHGEQTEKLLLQ